MPKTYVLDTNVLLHNPKALHAFSENDVVIPFAVIEEIDNWKRDQDEIGRHARMVSRKLCDEAQNLSPNMIKTLVTRVGEGSKIVFTGDPHQIDHPYLDASSNGLTFLVEKLKGEKIAGHVTLVKGERSQVAELGARLL
jgi:predicted ribonuclease YlaK